MALRKPHPVTPLASPGGHVQRLSSPSRASAERPDPYQHAPRVPQTQGVTTDLVSLSWFEGMDPGLFEVCEGERRWVPFRAPVIVSGRRFNSMASWLRLG